MSNFCCRMSAVKIFAETINKEPNGIPYLPRATFLIQSSFLFLRKTFTLRSSGTSTLISPDLNIVQRTLYYI